LGKEEVNGDAFHHFPNFVDLSI